MKEEDVSRYIAEQIADAVSDAHKVFGRMGLVPEVNPDFPAGGLAEVSKMKDEELMKVTASFIASEKDDE